MKRLGTFAFLLTLLIMAAPAISAGAPDCLMCHPEKARGRSVHKAVRMGCTTCHIGVDATEVPHRMLSGVSRGLPAESPELCFSCHDKKKFLRGRVVHAPVSGGMCTVCHDPHSSGAGSLLLSRDICFQCHDKAGFVSKKNIHPPVAGGMCTSCHNPHSSRNPKLLSAPVTEICLTCHDSGKFSGSVVHAPVPLGMCAACHDPHQSDFGRLARHGIPELCYTCHDQEDVGGKPVHKRAGDACLGCHRPHAAGSRFLLK